MESFVQILIAFLAGALLAFAGTFFWMKRKSSSAPDEAVRELEQYRQQVAEHFRQTATAVDQMTDSYKEVFEHLKAGANALLDEETLRRELTDESEEVITLNRLAHRSAGDVKPDQD